MIDCLNSNNHSVAVVHAQGESRFEHDYVFDDLYEKPCSVPDHVGIVTFCNKPALPHAVLLPQLIKNNIPFINAAVDLEIWHNCFKAQIAVLSIEAMPQHITHILCLDALDVMLNGDFACALNGWASYDKPVLFGATRVNSPDVEIDVVPDREQRGAFRWLNAGTSFGPRDDMLEFYKIVDEIEWDIDREQPLVRAAFAANMDWVDFDWRCRVFQTLGNANVSYENQTVRVT